MVNHPWNLVDNTWSGYPRRVTVIPGSGLAVSSWSPRLGNRAEQHGGVAGRGAPGLRFSRRAFTLLDLLVSIAVITILVGIMLPSLSGIRESTRKVICASNVRQIGLGIQMFSADHREDLPPTVFAKNTPGTSNPERMIMVRLGESAGDWDGLGELHDRGYLIGPGVYYCPSHGGESPLVSEASKWSDTQGAVLSNYQYRGAYVPGQALNLQRLAQHVALVTDGLASVNAYNHRVGANVLNADLAVFWFQDNGRLRDMLPQTIDDRGAAARVTQAWLQIDQAIATTQSGAVPPP